MSLRSLSFLLAWCCIGKKFTHLRQQEHWLLFIAENLILWMPDALLQHSPMAFLDFFILLGCLIGCTQRLSEVVNPKLLSH